MGITSHDIEKLISALIVMREINQSRLSFALENPETWAIMERLADNTVHRNASFPEHPIDSMIHILLFPEEEYKTNTKDETLHRFILNLLVVSLIQIGIMEDIGYTYEEAIENCDSRGFFAWMSSHGRHAASDDYDDIIDTLQRSDLWLE